MNAIRTISAWLMLAVLLRAGDAWTATNSMSIARDGHSATLLTSGRVLVVGGVSRSSAELYDPQTHAWYGAAGLSSSRSNHSATLLRDGRVLVAGGYVGAPVYGQTNTCHIYDPASDTWTPTGSMNQSRLRHVAVLLANGKVLAVGGNASLQPEEYDPAMTPPVGDDSARRQGADRRGLEWKFRAEHLRDLRSGNASVPEHGQHGHSPLQPYVDPAAIRIGPGDWRIRRRHDRQL